MAAPTIAGMNVDVFKSNFSGGSRPNRFAVTGTIPGPQGGDINHVVVRAASMPAVTIGIMRIPFRGRIVKIPGDRTYDEWTFTIYDTLEDAPTTGNVVNLRPLFMVWNNAFNVHSTNVPHADFTTYSGKESLFAPLNVHQLDLSGAVKRTVTLHNCWPTIVGEIALNYDSSDTLAEYSVTVAYDYLDDDSVDAD